jgi:predicted Zn-dependent protease with MMP-like domain
MEPGFTTFKLMKHTTPPSLPEIEALAREAMRHLPPELLRHADEVPVLIEDFPSEEIEQEMELDTPFDILGLYKGRSLDEKSVSDVPQDIDVIILYRRPILDYWCETGEDLADIIRHVLIHEIGHHFGFSDEDMLRIEEC